MAASRNLASRLEVGEERENPRALGEEGLMRPAFLPTPQALHFPVPIPENRYLFHVL